MRPAVRPGKGLSLIHILLDQPTNHLDLESITAVNNGLTDFPGIVLFTSQDHQFIETIANRIIEIHMDVTITDRTMTYDEYREWKKEQELSLIHI